MRFILGYDTKSFSEDVISRWGELSDELADNENLLHPQMATLGRLCLSKPNACDDVLSFLGEILARPDAISEIENAIAISFVQWPELESLSDKHEVPTNVVSVVKTQWERYGSNS